ncbi:hypothetical protein ACFLQU_04465 [Verrucomicrobiota bacterium]
MIELQSKRFYVIARRHQGESYGPVLDDTAGSHTMAYRRIEGTRETLVVQSQPDRPAIPAVETAYVYSPVFVGGSVVWSQQDGADWPIVTADDEGQPYRPFAIEGRARSMSTQAWGDRHALVWEERTGKRTRIRGVGVSPDGPFGQPFDITDGAYNAYDPSCAMAPDGTLYVAYSAFVGGNYAILLQAMDHEGQRVGAPLRVSREGVVCVWPSLHPRAAGGVWVSYTCYQANTGWELTMSGQIDFSYPDHYRRRAQSAFYTSYGVVKAGCVHEGRVWTVQREFKGEAKKGGVNIKDLGIAFARNAGHSAIFEDGAGVPHVLFRKHNPVEEIVYEEKVDMHRSPPMDSLRGDPDRNYADICLTALDGDQWRVPIRLIQHAFLERPISWRLDDRTLRVAFEEDGRTCGSEWTDDRGQFAVGVAEINLGEPAAPTYAPYPIVCPPMFGPSMEEPQPVRTDAAYRHAHGQTHIHSTISNCARSINKDLHLTYRFVQDVQHADYCGITDHAFDMWHTEMLITRKAAEYYYFPGEFVAIPSYEWTGAGNDRHEGGPFGHVDPLYLAEAGDLDFHTPKDLTSPGCTLPKLQKIYSGRPIIGIPHHPADPYHPYSWHMHDEAFSPVVELFQTVRGSYEQAIAPGNNNFDGIAGLWVVDALKRGSRVGFIGGGEHCGLALGGVLVTELTRTALYEGFMARRTFATTAQTLELNFTCNGVLMGQEVETDTADFHLTANAGETVHSLQIVHNGETVEEVPVDAATVDHRWSARRTEPGEFWYCRLIFANNDIAWSSPIWLV